ncbi:MAG: hypothetical protein IKD64_11600 [Lachnospiraceae bacterium]|nr:hypothetical protein [Lachnospiraceae bacterium]
MNREPNNRSIKNIPDLFDEALELEETIVQPSPEEADLLGEMAAETADITADPTFFDEQVINVPIIDPPDMKSISSYPDTQIYDHLFSTDDDFLLDEETEEDDDFLLDAEAVEDVISSMKESPADSETIELETTEPETIIDEVVPIFPDLEPAPAVKEPERTVSGKKPSKKPPVKRAGMPKKEVKVEEPAAIEETEKPIRKKPRVRRAGEAASAVPAAAAAVTSVEETFEAPPIELMEVSTPIVTPKKPAGKQDLPQRKTAGRTGTPHKKPTGARSAGKPGQRPDAKTPSAKPLRSKTAEQTFEPRKAPEEKAEQSKRSFSPLEKMRKKLARKWS